MLWESERYNKLKLAADNQFNLEKRQLQLASDKYRDRYMYIEEKLSEYHRLSISDKLEYIPGWVRYAIEFKLNANQYEEIYGCADLIEYTCERLYKKQNFHDYLESCRSMLPLTPNVDLYLRNIRNFNP